MIGAVAADLRREALATNERRLLVVAGDRERGRDAAIAALEAASIDRAAAVLVSERGEPGFERVEPAHAGRLLGTTQPAVVFDAHDGLDPNALGRVIGTVDGGGLFVLLTPPLDAWPDRRDSFDRTLAAPPFEVDDVTGYFRRRFVETLRAHPGIAVVDVDAGVVERRGLTHPAPRLAPTPLSLPKTPAFPREAYEACRTQDQIDALRAFESLLDSKRAVVVEADRGRGKSSVAGLAAGCFAARGDDVLVTAPAFRAAAAAFARARELLDAVGERSDVDGDARRVETAAGGRIRFAPPAAAAADDADVVLVDEAAAIPVALLASFLSADRAAFTTTIHGYEGAGRGFSVRFRDRLDASDLRVTDVSMTEPIRYAAGDPVEVWGFRALLLDASPAVEQVVADARPAAVEYRSLAPAELVADEPLLREAFGLLVLAHYRTEPTDLARLLDAPNIAIRALLVDGHVASVALLAREGGLPAALRARMYEGGRVRGNMLPDVLTSQLRDEAAGETVGRRVMRIATHAAVRSRGLGSRLLDEIRAEFRDEIDWLGVGYGATPGLLSFWDRNGYSTVHLSTTRNESSGEHSALMLAPASDAGRELRDRHASWFAERVVGMLSDALDGVDPDVVRAALRATDADVTLDLSESAWRFVAGMAYGPGLYDVDPRPFRRLVRKHLVDPADPDLLSADQERLLVRRVLQGHRWGAAATAFGFHSHREVMRALGDAFKPLVDQYGDEAARREARRYRREER